MAKLLRLLHSFLARKYACLDGTLQRLMIIQQVMVWYIGTWCVFLLNIKVLFIVLV